MKQGPLEFDTNTDKQIPKTTALEFDNAQQLQQQIIATQAQTINKQTKPRKLWRLFVGSTLMLTIWQLTESLILAWQNPLYFTLLVTVVASFCLLVAKIFWREAKALKALKQQQASANDPAGVVKQLAIIPGIDKGEFAHLKANIQQHAQIAGKFALIDRYINQTIDNKALKIVSEQSLATATLVGLSPIAFIDGLSIIWRNHKMISQLADCYGLQLGYWSRVKLLRQLLNNAIYGASTELMLDVASQTISMELTSKLSLRFAQGVGAGLLTAKLGLACMQQLRPLPFSKQTTPSLTQVHSNLLTQLKQKILMPKSQKNMAAQDQE
ncbi:YcjF family protein [Paraferrimonas sp. SM1919]|uniref:YcjF family protein n=1 Tax=Paraferrimonas sp. SM1919 TaxID=2662263 RepID=UPI0013D6F8B1|nr:YcjF family protein [Paraferrimonas sp. SM1919]